MRQVKIITDSCADLNAEQLRKYDIAFAKMSTSCDGVESVASLTWTENEAHEHYDKMRDGKRIHTAQVSVEEFGHIFEEYLKQNMDIVYIGCSSKQSGSVNTGLQKGYDLLKGFLPALDLPVCSLITLRVGNDDGLDSHQIPKECCRALNSARTLEGVKRMDGHVLIDFFANRKNVRFNLGSGRTVCRHFGRLDRQHSLAHACVERVDANNGAALVLGHQPFRGHVAGVDRARLL